MAEAMIRRLISKDVASANDIYVSEINEARRTFLAQKLGVGTTTSGDEVVQNTAVVVLAVKPDVAVGVLEGLSKSMCRHQPLLISICAGLELSRLSKALRLEEPRIVRVMPNTPCLVGEGASGYTLTDACNDKDKELAQTILSSFGLAFPIEEKKLNAVTGVSGSGPAYVYTFIEALADGGVLKGLPRNIARKLAAQTVFGAAKMVLDEPEIHTAELRNRVESPGGATIAATMALEVRGFRAAVMAAVGAAADRAEDMGN